MDVTPLGDSKAVAYASCGGVWVMLMHAPPKVDDMMAAVPTLERMAAVHPAGFSTLTWVLPSAGFTMDAPTRHAAAEVTKVWDKLIRAQATLIEGQGFQAASVRLIITGLDMLAKPTAPTKVFAYLSEAVDWALPFATVKTPPPDEVVAAIDAFRRRFMPTKG